MKDNGFLFLGEIFASFILRVLEGGLDYIWEQFTFKDINFKFLRDEHN